MKVAKKPMTLGQKIFYTLAFIILIGAFIFLGTRNYKIKELSDNELFNKEYKTVDINNHFQVLDSEETLTFLEKGTGILFLGFPENKWSTSIAEMLDQASKELDYSPVYYFNFKEERESRHDNYLGIMREIDDYLKKDDLGKMDILAPTVVAIEKGNVIYYDDETIFVKNKIEPKDYWTLEKKQEKVTSYKNLLLELKEKQN